MGEKIKLPNVLTFHSPDVEEVPLIFDSPHSGIFYPDEFHYICPLSDLRQSEDLFVAEFFRPVTRLGAYFLEAHFARAFLDVNRSDLDIDPLLLAEPWPWPTEVSQKSMVGMGLIRRLNKPGEPIYASPLTLEEVLGRLKQYYQPYHGYLSETVTHLQRKFGAVWLINCHSMPSLGHILGRTHRNEPDFVIGDRDGTTASSEFVELVAAFLRRKKYKVRLNDPYKGVEIVRRYGRPSKGQYAIQLEINKKLYMDEKNLTKKEGFSQLKADMAELAEEVALWTAQQVRFAGAAE